MHVCHREDLLFQLDRLALRHDGAPAVSGAIGWQRRTRARFEIEMGRFGIFLTSDHVPAAENRELISLFRRNCSRGWVIFVTADDNVSLGADHMDADAWVRERDEPEGIVESLCMHSPL